jgi:hypothetical protein
MPWQPGHAKRRTSNTDRVIHISPFVENHDDTTLPSLNTIVMRAKRRMRSRQFFLLLCLVAFAGLSVLYIRNPASIVEQKGPNPIPESTKTPTSQPPVKDTNKQGAHIGSSHPIWELMKGAEKEHEKKLLGQSKTLEEAVTEYRRRYGIPPPPNFDKWYEFAKAKGVQLIDEYDSIHHTLTPFWGLKPSTIRGRAKEALGYPGNNLIGALIRNGSVKKIDGAWGDWQKEATVGMMKEFIQHLPNMDLCFNVHDEPRVLVPYDDLSRLVATAKNMKMPAANDTLKPRNSWSKSPADMSDGLRFDDVKTTRFNVFAHQPTWTHSRVSCPPDSPARILEDGPKDDNITSYTVSELGFVSNQTAFSDICQSPSLSQTFGMFDRPNAYNIVHDLFPIFSQSKISSYSDIIYPSPWYWDGKVPYDENLDMDWAKKADKFYWRGSTTGGFSRDGGWRRQHRQHVVQNVNAGDQAKILINRGDPGGKEDWQVKEVPRSDYKEIFDIYFSHVGQCDETDCEAQKEFFDIKPPVEQQDAWQYKYLLDMDGNAFSGRFYAFLKSKSLVYKMAIFREWHEEWLKPWVHYIPLSLRGDEWVEVVRWFAGEALGKTEANRMALAGRDWANKVLRNEDFEVWFFRLLLE